MSRIKRYQFRPYVGLSSPITPPPATDDLDEALAVTATQPMDVWDTQYERWVPPIENDIQYHELLFRLNEKRRNSFKLKPKWGNICLAVFIVASLGYCTYVITR